MRLEASTSWTSASSTPFSVVVTDAQGRRYVLTLCDSPLFAVLQQEVWELNSDGEASVGLTMTEFARCVDAAEQNRALTAPHAIPSSEDDEVEREGGGEKAERAAAKEDVEEGPSPAPTLQEALRRSFRVDSSLFFGLAKALYELSWANGASPRRLRDHSPGFRLCVALFRGVYAAAVPTTPRGRTAADLLQHRRALLDAFRPPREDPPSGGRSESNLDSAWVRQHVLADAYFFPAEPGGEAGGRAASLPPPPPLSPAPARPRPPLPSIPSFADVTLSHIAARRMPADAALNDTPTFGLSRLLANPTWEEAEKPAARATGIGGTATGTGGTARAARCPGCGRGFRGPTRPLGVGVHHCRGCGRRGCARCVAGRADRSFARLRHPAGEAATPQARVCAGCLAQYAGLERVRFLGALFALAGLGFAEVALCRTVNSGWRDAAELCLSEYRLLLHTCEADLRGVRAPVGALLRNSVASILPGASEADGGREGGEGGPAGAHREAALLLLRFIAEEGLWARGSTRRFIGCLARVSPAIAARRPTFSHWHFYCTAFCRGMDPFYFYLKSLQSLCEAPADCGYVAEAKRMLCGHVLEELQRSCRARKGGATDEDEDGEEEAEEGGGGENGREAIGLATSAPANVQTAVVYLLDMLHRDATATAPRRQIYQDVLEVLLPAFVAANLQLALMVLCALQSTMRGVDGVKAVELLGLWRTRVLAELDHGERRAMTEATLDFFYGMDDFCGQTTSSVSRMGLVRWIRSYCSGSGGGRTRGGAIMKDPLAHPSSSSTSSTELGGPAGASIYADLPFPILNPFKPWIVLRSVLLTSVRAESLSSSKPVWITFSSANDAQRRNRKGGQKEGPSPPSSPEEKFYSFLYKRESAMRDQLMCISSRLLQWLLRKQIGDRVEIGNYSVLPLSDRSALIEHLEGYALSKLPGVANGNLALVTYLAQRGEAAQVNFLASAKLFLLLNYIFSIGDRHQGNVMMSPVGAILHIDFGYIFSEKTLVEKIAGTTMRVDSQFLSAVAFCRRAAAMAMTTASSDLPNDPSLDSSVGSDNNSLVMDNEGFFKEAAEWFLQVRPHAALFYELWRYAVRCQTLPFDERNLATIFNTLFDRSVSRESSSDNFLRIMEHSINVCRLKDVTHSSVQAFRSYTDYVARCVSETPSGVKRFFEYVWSHLNLSNIS